MVKTLNLQNELCSEVIIYYERSHWQIQLFNQISYIIHKRKKIN